MCSAAIDSHVLNSLFDNQKKLDDLFDSIFDDDNFFVNSATSTSSPASSIYSTYDAGHSFAPKRNNVGELLLTFKEQHPYFFMLPIVLEIAAIYFIVANML